jgi:hypothetical protein
VNNTQAVINEIRSAFQDLEFPGEGFLQGSFDGDEPYQEIAPFRTQKDWTALNAEFLDRHAAALNFFSEAGLRFFLPAFLIADLKGELKMADPVFHLTHGFFDFTVNVPVAGRNFTIKRGISTLINPRRYGAATFGDYARYRLSVFAREEANAIVAYLRFKCGQMVGDIEQSRVSAALEVFWLERARTAPLAANLQQHLAVESEYIEAIQSDAQDINKIA